MNQSLWKVTTTTRIASSIMTLAVDILVIPNASNGWMILSKIQSLDTQISSDSVGLPSRHDSPHNNNNYSYNPMERDERIIIIPTSTKAAAAATRAVAKWSRRWYLPPTWMRRKRNNCSRKRPCPCFYKLLLPVLQPHHHHHHLWPLKNASDPPPRLISKLANFKLYSP